MTEVLWAVTIWTNTADRVIGRRGDFLRWVGLDIASWLGLVDWLEESWTCTSTVGRQGILTCWMD